MRAHIGGGGGTVHNVGAAQGVGAGGAGVLTYRPGGRRLQSMGVFVTTPHPFGVAIRHQPNQRRGAQRRA